MATNLQFSIAVHIAAGLGYCEGEEVTSARLARSVNTSPSFVRRVLSKLSKAGVIETAKGKTGSCRLARQPSQISLLEIYRAVDAPKVFAIHHYPLHKQCAVSCGIKAAMEQVLGKSQDAMEATLAKITLADVLGHLHRE